MVDDTTLFAVPRQCSVQRFVAAAHPEGEDVALIRLRVENLRVDSERKPLKTPARERSSSTYPSRNATKQGSRRCAMAASPIFRRAGRRQASTTKAARRLRPPQTEAATSGHSGCELPCIQNSVSAFISVPITPAHAFACASLNEGGQTTTPPAVSASGFSKGGPRSSSSTQGCSRSFESMASFVGWPSSAVSDSGETDIQPLDGYRLRRAPMGVSATSLRPEMRRTLQIVVDMAANCRRNMTLYWSK